MPRFSKDRHTEPTLIVRSDGAAQNGSAQVFRGADTVLMGRRVQVTPMESRPGRFGRVERWLIGASILLGATSLGLFGLIAVKLLTER